jgi:hypothetical protein
VCGAINPAQFGAVDQELARFQSANTTSDSAALEAIDHQ